MPDVLDNERGPAPLWVVPLAMLAVVALVVSLAWRWNNDSDGNSDSAAPIVSLSPGTTSTETVLPTPSTAGNACGGDVEQPLIDAGPVPPNTRLRLLVGDRDLRSVDVDTGDVEVLATRKDTRSFTELAQTATQVLAVLRNPCSVEGYGNGLVAAVDPVDGELSGLGPGDAVLPGEPPTVLDVDASGETSIRTVGGATSTPVGNRWQLHARTSTGYFASVALARDAAAEVGVGSPLHERLTKSFGLGIAVAASPELLFWLTRNCPGPECLLTWTTAEGTNTALPMDTYACCGSVSPDGMKMAFRKQRANGRLGEHPGPPNDIAVLTSTSGGTPLTLLPGLVLPAKAAVTLTWSPDSQWLVIGADLGTGPAILIWRQGMDRPALVPVPPTGGGTTGPPALLVLPR